MGGGSLELCHASSKARSVQEGGRFTVDVERGTGSTSPMDLPFLRTQFFIITILRQQNFKVRPSEGPIKGWLSH